MSSNTTKRDVAVRIGSIVSNNTIDLFQSLTGDTLNVIGPSYKGKAFVPQNITDTPNVSLLVDNNTITFDTFNTIDNIIGAERKNIYAHLYDSYACLSENQCYDTIKTWLEGDRTQSTFTRILGIGSEKLNEEGQYIGSGFNASNRISRGSLDNLTKSRNPQAVDGGVEGNVTFFVTRVENDGDSGYIEDLGLSGANNYFLQKTIISADGILPSLSTLNDRLLENASSYEEQKKLHNFDNIFPYITFLGLKSNEDLQDDGSYTKTRNKVYISNEIRKPDSFLPANNISKMNYSSDRFLERGHIVYGEYPLSSGLIKMPLNPINSRIYTTRNYGSLNDNSLPDFNSFESSFKTAKTPWVTSQPVNRSGLENNRENLHEKVVNLFRFYSLDDGEIGNRFRIKINIKTKGNKDTNEYATFEIYLFEYEPRNNSFEQIDHIDNINLNPDSVYYICRLFGDEDTYYDIQNKKVVTKLRYPRKNKFLRVEVHPDVENKIISPELIPSGFRAYPHIRFNSSAFPDYVQGNIYQTPLLYSTNYIEDKVLGTNNNIKNNWGVVFIPTTKENNNARPQPLRAKYSRENSSIGFNLLDLSPHYFYTRYYLCGMKTESKNIWVEDDSCLNSFFHLEKIFYSNENVDDITNIDLKYTRKGNSSEGRNFIDLDNESIWDDDNTLVQTLEDKLSFDFFTYGGFDGVDIRDSDKRLMTNNALTREANGEDDTLSTLEDNPTYKAYSTAIDIATDSLLGEDLLILPGVSNLSLAEKCINICEEKKSIIFISDIQNHNTQIVEDLTEIDDNATYTNYYLDKTAIKVKEVNGSEVFKDTIDENFTNMVYRSNSTDSRFFIPVLGSLKGTKTFDNDSIIRKIDPSLVIVKKSSLTFTEILSGEINKIQGYDLELLNSRFNSSLETWENDSILFRSNKINVLHIPENNLGVSLLSDYTTYEVRKNILCNFDIIRKINIIKKELKYNLFTQTPVGMSDPVLFTQNSSIKKIYTILDIHLRSILDAFKESGFILDYLIKLPSENDERNLLDLDNYIIRGMIILKLNNNNNNDIINLNLDDVLSELSLLSKQSSIEVVQPIV